MDRDRVLAEVLEDVAHQRDTDRGALRTSDDLFARHLSAFVDFMDDAEDDAEDDLENGAGPSSVEGDASTRLLGAATQALRASKDPAVDATESLGLLADLCDEVDPRSRVGSFTQYVGIEAALACARVDLAHELLGNREPYRVWSDHSYAPVMLACAARTQVFAGNIAAALRILDVVPPPTVPGSLVRATKALAAGNAADLATMRALTQEVEADDVAPSDHLGRGVHLLLAFGVVALGDTLGAVRHLLRAGGGVDLEKLTIIDRVLGYELLVAAAVTEEDLALAQAWEQRAQRWSAHRMAAPTVSRIRSRVALLAGDPAAAERFAGIAIESAEVEGRVVERAEAEVVRAQALISGDQAPRATRDLRAAVAAGDQTGHAAVRVAATRALRPTRRRLPPPQGTGWESLSVRERDVAELILAGVDNAGIAASLSLSPTTVRTHATRVLTAFAVGTRIGLLAVTRPRPEAPFRSPGLTPRQADVAELVAAGRTNADIADRLGISVKSVERHVTDVLARWEARSRFEVAHRWWTEQADQEPDDEPMLGA